MANIHTDVIVIGGGPSGVMAAIQAAEHGASVILLEKTPRLLNKLRMSGKGRCNLTNGAEKEAFLENILRGQKFFMSAFTSFDNTALIAYIKSLGVPVKEERGQRIFPKSDKAEDIAHALSHEVRRLGISVKTRARVSGMRPVDGRWQVAVLDGSDYSADAVVLATGGKSYPGTGSAGDGYLLSEQLGHGVFPILASLAPIETKETWPKDLAGLSLKNVAVSAWKKGKRIFNEQGEMLFTHKGVSGPLILSASCHLLGEEDERILIDLKPALDEDTLDRRIQKDFQKYANRRVENSLGDLLPRSMISAIMMLWGVDGDKPVHQIMRAERRRLVSLLKALSLTIKQIGPIEEAIVTRGGINLTEIVPKTMESKLHPGLYFAGELMDLDGYTGGFNLQIAFSTGYLAGQSCARTGREA